eukprot:2173268-Amphidinium_carterae.1
MHTLSCTLSFLLNLEVRGGGKFLVSHNGDEMMVRAKDEICVHLAVPNPVTQSQVPRARFGPIAVLLCQEEGKVCSQFDLRAVPTTHASSASVQIGRELALTTSYCLPCEDMRYAPIQCRDLQRGTRLF